MTSDHFILLCILQMVRNYRRKSDRASYPKEAFAAAARDHANGMSIRKAAAENGIPCRTLARYIPILQANNGDTGQVSIGYKANRQVLTAAMESDIVDYCIKAARIFHGITLSELREIAYQLAVTNKCTNIPENWLTDGKAGIDWAKHFMKRHPDLTIRQPEATSIQRMTNFNPHNVGLFFNNLEEVLQRQDGYGPDQIYNVDEMGVTTVQKPVKILAQKGAKQVGSIVSQERGTLVTLCCAVNALGNHIPPFFVFPRVNVQDHWLLTAPPGSAATGHPSATGWMTADNLQKYMKHFVKYAKPSPERPILLLLDNHHSHISVEVINFAKNNHITLLSFPPHCSHELQPLDKSVFGLLKTYINQACDAWMRERDNAGKSMTIHVIPKIVSYAFPKAMTPENIRAGFKATGIYPYDRNIFPPEKFLSCYTADRPDPNRELPDQPQVPDASDQPQIPDGLIPSTSGHVTAESVRPFGKGAAKTQAGSQRKKGKTEIYTDTPVKQRLEQEKQRSASKKMKKQLIPDKPTTEPSSDSDSDSEGNSDRPICDDSSEVSELDDSVSDLEIDDHNLVSFPGKKSVKYYVGRIREVDVTESEITTSFMRRAGAAKVGSSVFSFPDQEDICTHPSCGNEASHSHQGTVQQSSEPVHLSLL